MMELFQEYDVEFVSSTEKFDTSTPMGRAMLNICIVFAQLERETIQKRVTDAYYSRCLKGFHMSGQAPYGYQLEPIPIFSIAELEKAYFLGFDAPTLNQYLLFGVADILFIISAVMYLSNAALLYWKESKVSRKYHNTSLFLFGQLSSKLAIGN